MMDFPLFPPFYPLPKQTASSVLTALQHSWRICLPYTFLELAIRLLQDKQ